MSRFYKTPVPLVAPMMTQAFEEIDETHPLPSQLLPSQIAVIPKLGKDPSSCSNYRPISILNVDLKLFLKMIANHVAPLLPNSIHSNQVGFIPGQEAMGI